MPRSLLMAAALLLPIAQASAQPAKGEFFIHAFHKDQLGGTLDCSLCHVPVREGSVVLKRPGHDRCIVCHSDDFNANPKQNFCAQCHTGSPPTGAAGLLPFPRYKGWRTILSGFSHRQHADPKARTDAKTGFRADCTFCHKSDSNEPFAARPGHEQCATCHSKPGMKTQLNASLTAEGCRGCHKPEEIENQGRAAAVRYADIRFSHAAHFKLKEQFRLNCTTCHSAIPTSTGIGDLTLPKMLDCVQCHDSARAVAAEFRISNCKTCHLDRAALNSSVPKSHTRNVKPDFHTEAFRLHHAEDAAAPNAKCFVCHQNVQPSMAAKLQCDSCHRAMLPASHTSRWKDDLHGKYAALDRTSCATCHTASYCSDCHNELPRSHNPLPMFKAGGHAFPAKLELRGCFTCHTFQNTCQQCHQNKIN